MGGLAASGGYYVSMCVGDQPDTIFAEPTTWTGSIGVMIPHYNIAELMRKLGIQDDAIASDPLKTMGSIARKMTDQGTENLPGTGRRRLHAVQGRHQAGPSQVPAKTPPHSTNWPPARSLPPNRP